MSESKQQAACLGRPAEIDYCNPRATAVIDEIIMNDKLSSEELLDAHKRKAGKIMAVVVAVVVSLFLYALYCILKDD